jgi:hypothetical protein
MNFRKKKSVWRKCYQYLLYQMNRRRSSQPACWAIWKSLCRNGKKKSAEVVEKRIEVRPSEADQDRRNAVEDLVQIVLISADAEMIDQILVKGLYSSFNNYNYDFLESVVEILVMKTDAKSQNCWTSRLLDKFTMEKSIIFKILERS